MASFLLLTEPLRDLWVQTMTANMIPAPNHAGSLAGKRIKNLHCPCNYGPRRARGSPRITLPPRLAVTIKPTNGLIMKRASKIESRIMTNSGLVRSLLMSIRLFALLISASCLVALSNNTRASENDVIDGAVVFVQADKPTESCDVGCGFFVSNDELVTPYHVIRLASRIRVFADYKNDARLYDSADNQLEVYAIAPAYDLAVLKLTRGQKPPAIVTLDSCPLNLANNQEIEVAGHKMAMLGRRYQGKTTRDTLVETGKLDASQGTNIFGVDNVDLVITDLAVPNSMHGAPLYRNRQVIGVVSGSRVLQSGLTIGWAIPTSYVAKRGSDRKFQAIRSEPDKIRDWPTVSLLAQQEGVTSKPSEYTVLFVPYSRDQEIVTKIENHPLYRDAQQKLIKEGYRVRPAKLPEYLVVEGRIGRTRTKELEPRVSHSIQFNHEDNLCAQQIERSLAAAGEFELIVDERFTFSRDDKKTVEVLFLLSKLDELHD